MREFLCANPPFLQPSYPLAYPTPPYPFLHLSYPPNPSLKPIIHQTFQPPPPSNLGLPALPNTQQVPDSMWMIDRVGRLGGFGLTGIALRNSAQLRSLSLVNCNLVGHLLELMDVVLTEKSRFPKKTELGHPHDNRGPWKFLWRNTMIKMWKNLLHPEFELSRCLWISWRQNSWKQLASQWQRAICPNMNESEGMELGRFLDGLVVLVRFSCQSNDEGFSPYFLPLNLQLLASCVSRVDSFLGGCFCYWRCPAV